MLKSSLSRSCRRPSDQTHWHVDYVACAESVDVGPISVHLLRFDSLTGVARARKHARTQRVYAWGIAGGYPARSKSGPLVSSTTCDRLRSGPGGAIQRRP